MFTRSIITAITFLFTIAFVGQVCFAQSGSRNSVQPSAPQPAVSTPSPSLNSPSVSAVQVERATDAQSVMQTPMPMQGEFIEAPMMEVTDSAVFDGSSYVMPEPEGEENIWTIHDPESNYVVDHSFWDCFLSYYVVTDSRGLNRVRYSKVSSRDRNKLNCYLRYLQSVDVRTLNRDEQLAFWSNLYNAQIISIVLKHYPIRSVRQIKTDFKDKDGPFNDKVVCVLGQSLTLTEVESDIIRPVFKDPRVHYAINCASYGCPNVQKRAWRAENLSADLDCAAYQFINSNRSMRVGPFGCYVRLSKIYEWYEEDFGGSEAAVLRHICSYANAKTRHKIRRADGVDGYFYDWSLNDAKRERNALLERFIR